MKNFLLILLTVLFGCVSCKTKTQDPRDIISSKNIELKINRMNCFSHSVQSVHISWVGNERNMTCKLLDGFGQPDMSIKFTPEKERILSEIIDDACESQDTLYKSTMTCENDIGLSITVLIRTESYQCDQFYGDCKLDSLLGELFTQ